MLEHSQDGVPLPEASRRLRMSGEKTRRRLLEGRLEGHLVNGRWYITAQSIERYLAAQGRGDDSRAA